jgi:hypothetical protein
VGKAVALWGVVELIWILVVDEEEEEEEEEDGVGLASLLEGLDREPREELGLSMFMLKLEEGEGDGAENKSAAPS